MPAASATSLLCPVCRNRLRFSGAAGRALVCPAGHSFDAAKQGYFNFLVGKGTVFEADTADMVAARFDFLSAGHYRPLADAVAELAAPALAGAAAERPGTVLDAGTGTGHYLRALLDRLARTAAPRRGHRPGHFEVRAPPRRQAEPGRRERGQRRVAAAAGRRRRRRRRHRGVCAAQRGGVRPGAPPRRPARRGDAPARATSRRWPARPACSGSTRRRTNGSPPRSTDTSRRSSAEDLDVPLALSPRRRRQAGPHGPGRAPPGPRRLASLAAGAPAAHRRVRPVPDQRFRAPPTDRPAYPEVTTWPRSRTLTSAALRRPLPFGLGWKDSY